MIVSKSKSNRTKRTSVNSKYKQEQRQADKLVLLTAGMDFFHSAGTDGMGYVSFKNAGHRETWPINSMGFREYLARLYYSKNEKTPNTSAMTDALAVLLGRAKFAGPTLPVGIRVSELAGNIYIDLCDERWRVVEVTGAGWKVIADSPVRFVRKRGMMALPLPKRGGSIAELRPFLNLADDDAWRLFVGWLVAAFRPNRPFTVLAVSGEQGSAKSTLCRIARRLIDPNAAELRRLPKDERDLAIAASNGWILAFENLSGLPGIMSDAICALATGGGFATRLLYSDDEERVFDAKRPIMLNGITDVVSRSDLIDRSIMLILPAINDSSRRTESALWEHLDRILPRVLGALLDAVAVGLRNLPTTKMSSNPRMADFAQWVVACEPALGWELGGFLSAYHRNRSHTNAIALESSPIAPLIVELMANCETWVGTVNTLLGVLKRKAGDATKSIHGWPGTPKALGGHLRRIAPNLRQNGLEISFGERGRAGFPVTIKKVPQPNSQSTPPAPPVQMNSDYGEHIELREPNSGTCQGEQRGFLANDLDATDALVLAELEAMPRGNQPTAIGEGSSQ